MLLEPLRKRVKAVRSEVDLIQTDGYKRPVAMLKFTKIVVEKD
jgi:endonuclease YncB( thermonuclease family)